MYVGTLAAVTGIMKDPEAIADWSLLIAGVGPVFVIVNILRESKKI